MKFSDLMSFYDYKYKNIIEGLKVARETVNTWRRTDRIPFKWQCIIEVISGGKLKVDKDLHIDDDIRM
jgi:hypothetical protein